MWKRVGNPVLYVVCALALSAALTTAPMASAQGGDVAAAATAFSRAQEAELRGENARAADLYELADRLSPAPATLRNATRARMAAGQLASAARNAEELTRRYPEDPGSQTLAAEVLTQARQKLARVAAQCQPECRIVIDGLASGTDEGRAHVVFLQPGAHTIVARFADGGSASQRVDNTVGQELNVELNEPAPAASSAPPSGPVAAPALATPAPLQSEPAQDRAQFRGLHPAVGLIVGGVALGLGGLAIWSAADTRNARDDFNENPTRDAFDNGENKDLRTNVLIGASGVVAAASVGLLVFATDWSGKSEARSSRVPGVQLFASTRGTGLNVRGSF